MDDTNCPYHTDHSNRLRRLEQSCDDLDDRITELDKSHAINRAEITSSLKNLEKLPETMIQISNTMVTIQNEIKSSNTAIDSRIHSVEEKIDSKFTGVNEKIKDLNGKVTTLDNKVIEINESDTINIRHSFKNWLIKNWKIIGFGILFIGLYLTELIKNMVTK